MAERTPSSTHSYASSGGFDSAPSGGTDSYSGGGSDDDGGGYSGGDDDDGGGSSSPRTVTETTRIPSATASYARAGGFDDAPSGGTDSGSETTFDPSVDISSIETGGAEAPNVERPSYESVSRRIAEVTQPTVEDVAAAELDDEVSATTVTRRDVERTGDGFTLDDDAQARVAATEIDRRTEFADVGADDLVREDGRYALDDETLAAEARGQAASEDPLREPEDFVAETEGGDVSVRRRARPFFEEQREALGGDPPEESVVRRSIRERSQQVTGFFEETASNREEALPSVEEATADVPGSAEVPMVTAADTTRGAGAALNPYGAVDGLARTGERAANVVQADQFGTDEELRDELSAQGEATSQTLADLEETALEDPGAVVGAVGTGLAVSAGFGAVTGRAATGVKDAVRTAGGDRIELEELTNVGTARYFSGDNDDPSDRFPGAQDEQLYRTRPAEAVRRQSENFTPEALRGEDGQAPLYKAIEVEPEGPERSTGSARGFETQEGDYENPGANVGPELSPNFLGVETEYSIRPGLPDTGGSPTAVAVRTDVGPSDSSTNAEFNRELMAREGETTARTKPPESSEFNVGEIEAVAPPGASFRDAGDGGLARAAARRLGIGADYYTVVNERAVPIRQVEPDEGRPARQGLVDDERGQAAPPSADSIAFRGTLDDISSRGRRRTDRPFPASGVGFSGTSSSERRGTSSPRAPSIGIGSGGGSSGGGGSGGSGSGSGSGGSGGSPGFSTGPPSSPTAPGSPAVSPGAGYSGESFGGDAPASPYSPGGGLTIGSSPPPAGSDRRRDEDDPEDPYMEPRRRQSNPDGRRESDAIAVGWVTETVADLGGIDSGPSESLDATFSGLEEQRGESPFGEFAPDFTGREQERFDETSEFLFL